MADKRQVEKEIKKLPTSEDVARLAGVSRATVSAYINGTRYVSDKLIQRIDRAIEILHYTPNEIARSLKLQSNKAIGLLIPVLSKFYLPMIRSINERIHERGYTMILGSSEEDIQREKEVLQVFTSKKVSGILIVPCGYRNAGYIERLSDSGIAFVQLNRRIERLDMDSVVSDTVQAIYDAMQHMVKKRGKKRIALMGYNPNIIADNDKRTGYQNALREFNLESFIFETVEHDQDILARNLTEFMSTKKIDGVVCTTRTFMEVVLCALRQSGRSIPGEVSVIGYDDPVWTTLVEPNLTVISEDRFSMGEQAVNMLFDRIEGRSEDKPKHIVMQAELIVRDS